jgi:hypothetical protein
MKEPRKISSEKKSENSTNNYQENKREYQPRNQQRYERSSFKKKNYSFRFGQIFGFFYHIALLYFISDLIKREEQELALKIFIINASVITVAVILNALERRFYSSKRPSSRNGNRRFKDFKKRDSSKR